MLTDAIDRQSSVTPYNLEEKKSNELIDTTVQTTAPQFLQVERILSRNEAEVRIQAL